MEDMEISRGILEKGQACRNSWGQLKREVEFPGVLKKNSCGISMGLVVFDLVLETYHEKRCYCTFVLPPPPAIVIDDSS